MTLYSVDLQVAATVYIKGASKDEAAAKLTAKLAGPWWLQVEDGEQDISSRPYDSPNLPDISLSPAMTVIGIFDGGKIVECGQ